MTRDRNDEQGRVVRTHADASTQTVTSDDPWARSLTDRLDDLLDRAGDQIPSEVDDVESGFASTTGDEDDLSELGDEWFDAQPPATTPPAPPGETSELARGPWSTPSPASSPPPTTSRLGARERPTTDVPVVNAEADREDAIVELIAGHLDETGRCVLAIEGAAYLVDTSPVAATSSRFRAREPGGRVWTAPSIEALVERALRNPSAGDDAIRRLSSAPFLGDGD